MLQPLITIVFTYGSIDIALYQRFEYNILPSEFARYRPIKVSFYLGLWHAG
jgi:hypothetical protein